MIIIDKTIISSDIYEEQFICDLDKCKGACCVEGDLGAPLELKELPLIESAVKKAKNYLSNESKEILEKDGAYILDEEGDFSTTTLKGKECSFAFYDDEKTLKCSIEQAWLDGKSNFRKPISCHLYPIRISQLQEYETLNYDRWSICECARILGKNKGIAILPVPLKHKKTLDFSQRPKNQRIIREIGLDYFDRYKKVFKQVDIYDSDSFNSKYNLTIGIYGPKNAQLLNMIPV